MSVELTIEGAVAKIVLNRPDKLNALTVEMREEFGRHVRAVAQNDDVRAVLITGAGRAFCAGADIGGMAGGDLKIGRRRFQEGGQAFIRALHALEKPVVAAVRGPAVGIGWSIALACDLVIASQTARFSQIFRNIGLAPDGGAIWFLARRIGMPKLKELVFTGRFVEAEEALALGLVNEVVADERLDERAAALACELGEGPSFALGLAKALCNAAGAASLEDYLAVESFVQPPLHHTADHEEGRAAFREKRKPRFIGR